MKASLIIINYNGADLTVDCISSAKKTAGNLNIEMLVVDNASTDDSYEKINKKHPDIKIIRNSKNLGYAGAVNKGVFSCSGEYAAASNNDIIFKEGSLETLLKFLEATENAGACGPQQLYSDGSWQYSYGYLPGIKLAVKDLFFISAANRLFAKLFYKINNEAKPVEYIDGALMVIKKDIFVEVGGFDEDYFFFTEEADFCKKLYDKGFYCYYCPEAQIIHLRGASYEAMAEDEKRAQMFISSKIIYCRKHLSKLASRGYILIELLHSVKMKILYNLFGIINKKFRKKAKTHGYFIRFWKKHLTEF